MVTQFYLANTQDQLRTSWIQRFDARYWQVVTTGSARACLLAETADQLHLICQAQRGDEWVDVLWESSDSKSHSLLRALPGFDYRGLLWSFTWRASGLASGIVQRAVKMIIEGRDKNGIAKNWVIPAFFLNNSRTNNRYILDFDNCRDESGEVIWAGDIARVYMRIFPSQYTGVAQWTPQTSRVEVHISNIEVDGAGARIKKGDAYVPRHPLGLYVDYDNHSHHTPAAIVESIEALGYKGPLLLDIGRARFYSTQKQSWRLHHEGDALNSPASAWLTDFLTRAKAANLDVHMVIGAELPSTAVDPDLAQQSRPGYVAGQPLPQWVTLCWHLDMHWAWLNNLVLKVLDLQTSAGHAAYVHLRDYTWMIDDLGVPMLQAPSLLNAYRLTTGLQAPSLPVLGRILSANARDYKNWCVAQWAKGWSGLMQALQARATKVHVGVMLAGNMLQPAYMDFILTDAQRDHVQSLSLCIDRDWPLTPAAQLLIKDYVQSRAISLHYVSIFSAHNSETILSDLAPAQSYGYKPILSGLPSLLEQGAVFTDIGDQGEPSVRSFEDVAFPLDVGAGFQLSPEYQTQIVRTASGHEYRNAMWSLALARYDAAAGVRSREDMQNLLRFFHARMGRAVAFSLRDPLDYSSNAGAGPVEPTDQVLGLGDGRRTRFALVKQYQDQAGPRTIVLPILNTVQIAVNGVVVSASLYRVTRPGGYIEFLQPPAVSAVVTAGFEFDVPVRFEEDHIDLELQAWRAGTLASVPMREVRAL